MKRPFLILTQIYFIKATWLPATWNHFLSISAVVCTSSVLPFALRLLPYCNCKFVGSGHELPTMKYIAGEGSAGRLPHWNTFLEKTENPAFGLLPGSWACATAFNNIYIFVWFTEGSNAFSYHYNQALSVTLRLKISEMRNCKLQLWHFLGKPALKCIYQRLIFKGGIFHYMFSWVLLYVWLCNRMKF